MESLLCFLCFFCFFVFLIFLHQLLNSFNVYNLVLGPSAALQTVCTTEPPVVVGEARTAACSMCCAFSLLQSLRGILTHCFDFVIFVFSLNSGTDLDYDSFSIDNDFSSSFFAFFKTPHPHPHPHPHPRRVRFGVVSVREYAATEGDADIPFPLSLDWAHTATKTMCLDDYECNLKRSSVKHMTKDERKSRLEEVGELARLLYEFEENVNDLCQQLVRLKQKQQGKRSQRPLLIYRTLAIAFVFIVGIGIGVGVLASCPHFHTPSIDVAANNKGLILRGDTSVAVSKSKELILRGDTSVAVFKCKELILYEDTSLAVSKSKELILRGDTSLTVSPSHPTGSDNAVNTVAICASYMLLLCVILILFVLLKKEDRGRECAPCAWPTEDDFGVECNNESIDWSAAMVHLFDTGKDDSAEDLPDFGPSLQALFQEGEAHMLPAPPRQQRPQRPKRQHQKTKNARRRQQRSKPKQTQDVEDWTRSLEGMFEVPLLRRSARLMDKPRVDYSGM